jgi:hypothetical protein
LMVGILGRAQAAQTAGAAAEVDGIAIDRLAASLNQPHGAVAFIMGRATLASGNTLSVIGNWQHSISSTQSFADVGTALSTTLVLNAAGGALAAQPWRARMPLILSECAQYVRTQVTPVFSATGTDTCEVQQCVVMYGATNNPAS